MILSDYRLTTTYGGDIRLVHEVTGCYVASVPFHTDFPTIAQVLTAATVHEAEVHPRTKPPVECDHNWHGYDVPTNPLMVYCTRCEKTRAMGS